ncbi:MAG: TlpA family protein disulfide reductase, partial [bacterium]|nr:TlpA family protein disulfide reductase [bacterium]
MTPKLISRVLLVTVAVMSTMTFAQSAEEILDASKAAIAEIDGFQAQFRMKGEGGSMFAETMPSMSGQVFFGTHDEFGRVIHTIGESKDKQKDPSKPMDQLIAGDRFIWVDRQEKTINEAPRGSTVRGLPSSLNLVLISSIINDDPYAQDTDGAVSITLGAQEAVAGEMCDQIVIKRPEAKGSRRGAQAYTDAIWWISTSDKLPRKVQQITDAGMVKITLEFEMSNLRVIEAKQDQLDVRRPDGFSFVSSMPKPRGEAQDAPETLTTEPTDRPTADQPAQDNDRPRPPTVPSAPSFSFSTVSGDSVDNSTQQGRVTMLYFMGSWCVPCAQTTPLISTLRDEISDDAFDLYALSVREGDPQNAER